MANALILADVSIELEHVFDYHVTLKPPVAVGKGPYGTRVFFEVTGGEVSGPRVNGSVLGGGGDWALIGDDGWLRLDVRGQIQTDDEAIVYMTYRGVLELNEAVQAAMAPGAETAFGDHYYRTVPEFETGDERYRWLTQSVFVARGRAHPDGVAYEVFRVG
jgi:Protein of unknown function (DUF3237)